MKRARRHFTPEQKVNIVNQIETNRKNGFTFTQSIEKKDIKQSLYLKWRRKLEVGIKSSICNGKPPVDVEKKIDPRG